MGSLREAEQEAERAPARDDLLEWSMAKHLAYFYLHGHKVREELVKDLTDEEGNRCHGLWCDDTKTISLCADDLPDVRNKTRIHERLHMISDCYDWDWSEDKVRLIENALWASGVRVIL